MNSLYFSFLCAMQTFFSLGIDAHRDRNYIASAFLLELSGDSSPSYHFHQACNYSFLNRKDLASKHMEAIEFSQERIPERYKSVIALMRNDQSFWKDDWNDLADISREMKRAADRIHSKDLSKNTSDTQKEIIDRLDRMIKNLEDKMKPKDKDGDGENSSEQSPGSSNPMQPAQDSHIDNTAGSGKVDRVKFRGLQERWGSLPPREQARALQDILRSMPMRYREGIENYFRNLTIRLK